MTTPKRKGYRSIVVAGRRFKWRFADRVVVVADGLSGRQVLEVDFGWFDEWLYVNDRAGAPPSFSPRVATPAFVAQAIQFALANGWNTDVRGGRFLVKYAAADGFRMAPLASAGERRYRSPEMPKISGEVEHEVVRRFSAVDAAGVLAALRAMTDPPSESPEWARDRARVQLAIVKLSNGDRAAFDRQLESAQSDWRDTLCAAGLENADWPAVLRAAGYSVPR